MGAAQNSDVINGTNQADQIDGLGGNDSVVDFKAVTATDQVYLYNVTASQLTANNFILL